MPRGVDPSCAGLGRLELRLRVGRKPISELMAHVTLRSAEMRRVLKTWMVLKSPFHREFPPPRRSMVYEIDKRIMVDRKRAFVYFRIPKAANSTVVYSLIPSSHTSKEAKRALPRASSLTRSEVSELSERFFLFTVVRNPYSRLASAYLEKIVRAKRADKVARFLGRALTSHISFLDFCRYLNAGGIYEDPHWYRQCDLIPSGVGQLHFVGRVESLRKDLEEILRRVQGGPCDTPRSWTRHATGATSRLKELYCAESIEIVRDLYAHDFTAFGYSDQPDWI